MDVLKQFVSAIAEESLRVLELPTAADAQDEYRKKAAAEAQDESRKRPAADIAPPPNRPAKRSPHPSPVTAISTMIDFDEGPPTALPSQAAPKSTPAAAARPAPSPRRRGAPQQVVSPYAQDSGPAQEEGPGPSHTPDGPRGTPRIGVRSAERKRTAPGRYRDDAEPPPPRRAQANAEAPANRVEDAAGLGSPQDFPGKAHTQTARRRDPGNRYPGPAKDPSAVPMAAAPMHSGAFSQQHSSAVGRPEAAPAQEMSPAEAVHAALMAGQAGGGAGHVTHAPVGTGTGTSLKQPVGGSAHSLAVRTVPPGPQPSLPPTQAPMSVGVPAIMGAPQSVREGLLSHSGALSPTGVLSPSGTPKMSDQVAAAQVSFGRDRALDRQFRDRPGSSLEIFFLGGGGLVMRCHLKIGGHELEGEGMYVYVCVHVTCAFPQTCECECVPTSMWLYTSGPHTSVGMFQGARACTPSLSLTILS